MRTWTLGAIVAACLIGCGYGDPNEDPPSPPTANHPEFSSTGKTWYLVGDGATPGDDQLKLVITPPAGSEVVDAYLAGLAPVRLTEQADGFALDISIASLPIGAHELLLSANTSDTAFAKLTINRSAAYYVLVSTDYDFSDPGNGSLGFMDMLHAEHPGMIITHFWAPYTYTDPQLPAGRADELDAWLKKQRDMFGDEIALHIHPYCHFVQAAGQTCVTDQSTVYAVDESGYTVKLGAYGRTAMGALLQHAHTLFNQRGLGTPTTFRAGGWTADINTLLALDDNGYVADTSALNWKYIEEWARYELYKWNMANWSQITDTSQPYYPSTTNPQISQAGSNMAMLEVPDNGVMIDYLSVEEQTAIFDANFDGKPLEKPTTLMMGFHPAPQFSNAEFSRVDAFLDYADKHLAETGTGPVVYISLADVTKAFPAQ